MSLTENTIPASHIQVRWMLDCSEGGKREDGQGNPLTHAVICGCAHKIGDYAWCWMCGQLRRVCGRDVIKQEAVYSKELKHHVPSVILTESERWSGTKGNGNDRPHDRTGSEAHDH